jgi:hypothetical protein
LTPEDYSKIVACCVVSESQTQFDVGQVTHLPLEMTTPAILNNPATRNPVDLIQVSVEARQFTHLCLFTDQAPMDEVTEMYGNAITNEMQWTSVDINYFPIYMYGSHS